MGKACPSAEETIKWNVPFFLLGDKILASMAAFKKHVKVGVWTGMMPKFVDVSEVEDLPASKDFAQQLQIAAKAIDGAMTPNPRRGLLPNPPSSLQRCLRRKPPRRAPAEESAGEESARQESRRDGLRQKDTEQEADREEGLSEFGTRTLAPASTRRRAR